MANDEDVIYVDIVPRLDEKATEKQSTSLRETLKKGAKDVGRVIADQITSDMDEGLKKGAEKSGKKAGSELADKLAKEFGSKAGEFLHDQISDSLKDVGVDFDKVIDKGHQFGDVFRDFKAGDKVQGFRDLADALTGLPGPLDTVGKKSGDILTTFDSVKGSVLGATGSLEGLAGDSGKIAAGLSAIEGAAGPLAATFAILDNLMPGFDDHLSNVTKQLQGLQNFNVKDWINVLAPGNNITDLLIPKFTQPDTVKPKDGISDIPNPITGPAVPPGYTATPGSLNPLDALLPVGVPALAGTPSSSINDPSTLGGLIAPDSPSQPSTPKTQTPAPSNAPVATNPKSVVIQQPTITEPKITGSAGSSLGGSSSGAVHVIVDGFGSGASVGGFFGGAGLSAISGGGAGPFYDNPASRASMVPNAPNVEAGIRSMGGLGSTLYPTSGPGAYQVPPWAQQLAKDFNLTASTYSNGGSLHQMGYAMDFNGAPADEDRFSDYIQQNLSPQTLQLIHASGNRRWGIASGKDVSQTGYYAGDYGGHYGHVHWATDVPPLSSPPSGAPMSWSGMGGAAGGGRQGGMSQGYGGGVPGMGQDMFFGPGIVSPPTMPNAAGPAPTGPKQQVPFGSGPGGGVSGGGLIGLAEQGIVGAATAAGFMGAGGPLAGMAAQAGTQIANQAISTGVQAASILASAPLQTLGLQGGQFGAPTVQLGGWAGKILGGLVGQQANTPNIAGATADPKKPDDKHDPLNGNQPPAGTPNGPSGGKDDPIHVKSADAPQQPPQGAASNNMNMGAGNLPQLQL